MKSVDLGYFICRDATTVGGGGVAVRSSAEVHISETRWTAIAAEDSGAVRTPDVRHKNENTSRRHSLQIVL